MLTELIEALQILAKYDNPDRPTYCEHDVLTVLVNPNIVSEEDRCTLDGLGFIDADEESFQSFRFGSV